MKIRQGFVSNSSSSSFIVKWEKEPKSAEEIKEILFGDAKFCDHYDYVESTDRLAQEIFSATKTASPSEIKEEIASQYSYWGDSWYEKGYKADEELCKQYEIEYKAAQEEEEEVLRALEKEYSDSEKNRILRKQKLERVLDENSLDTYEKGYLELLENLEKVRKITWGRGETMQKLIDDSYEKYMKDNEGKFISLYEFSDNDGSLGCVLEHGDVFYKVEHTRTSHH